MCLCTFDSARSDHNSKFIHIFLSNEKLLWEIKWNKIKKKKKSILFPSSSTSFDWWYRPLHLCTCVWNLILVFVYCFIMIFYYRIHIPSSSIDWPTDRPTDKQFQRYKSNKINISILTTWTYSNELTSGLEKTQDGD